MELCQLYADLLDEGLPRVLIHVIFEYLNIDIQNISVMCSVRGCHNDITHPFIFNNTYHTSETMLQYIQRYGYPQSNILLHETCYLCYRRQIDSNTDHICNFCNNITYDNLYTCDHCCPYCTIGWSQENHQCDF